MSDLGDGDSPKDPTEITIARWSDRFFAWLIDYVIIFGIAFTIFFIIIGTANFEEIIRGEFVYSRSFEFAPISIAFFAYWLILEYKTGQSIGKIALHLKITNLKGESADFKSIVISSAGKAFLLPVDVFFGRLFTNKKRQRIFNRLGKTIVIKITDDEKDLNNITYKKD
ncbi:MAG TPA: RDD family protein [Nitrosopumilaceae archaeon]|nr:RDD family protein [Nitrosopumilaceae archaeon]